MKVIVYGGKIFNQMGLVESTLNEYGKAITMVIHGGETDTDKFSSEWANRNSKDILVVSADHVKYGKTAEYVRCAEMLSKLPKMVFLFGPDKSTELIRKLARQVNVRVFKI